MRTHLVALMADHRHDLLRLEHRHRGQHVADHAAPADPVQHLHGLGLHPRAAPGSQHDHGQVARRRHERSLRLERNGSPGRSRTYVASPDSKSGGPCRQTNRGKNRQKTRASTRELAAASPPTEPSRRCRWRSEARSRLSADSARCPRSVSRTQAGGERVCLNGDHTGLPLGFRHGPACDAAGAADAGEGGEGDPGPGEVRRAVVRAEVGRVPVPGVQGRRRGRAGQPQHQAADALLPGGGGGGPGAAAGAVRARRRAVRRAAHRGRRREAGVRDPAGADPPGRRAASPCSPRRPRRGSWRSTCSRSGTRRTSTSPFGERRAALEEALAHLTVAGSGPVSPEPHHDRPGAWPRSGSGRSRAPDSTA